MWETETAINIAAPTETVYEYLADFPRHSEWSTGMEELAPVSKGPVRRHGTQGNGESSGALHQLYAHHRARARATHRLGIVGRAHDEGEVGL